MTGTLVAAAAGLTAVALLVAPTRGVAAHRLAAAAPPARPAATPAQAGAGGAAYAPPVRTPVALGAAVALLVAGTLGVVSAVVLGAVLAAAVAVGLPRLDAARRPRRDPWAEAGAWDQLAACLRAGLPLAGAVRAVVPGLPSAAGTALSTVADLVALGADPADAWAPALAEPATARLARAARRSARSGAAIADVAAAVATETRAESAETVLARAERAAVLVTGPLGLCFLPAFLALGIVPVVIGLAGPLLEQQP